MEDLMKCKRFTIKRSGDYTVELIGTTEPKPNTDTPFEYTFRIEGNELTLRQIKFGELVFKISDEAINFAKMKRAFENPKSVEDLKKSRSSCLQFAANEHKNFGMINTTHFYCENNDGDQHMFTLQNNTLKLLKTTPLQKRMDVLLECLAFETRTHHNDVNNLYITLYDLQRVDKNATKHDLFYVLENCGRNSLAIGSSCGR